MTACSIACCCSFPEEPIISRGFRIIGVVQTRVLTNRKCFTVRLPARAFLLMPPPEHVPFWEDPAPGQGKPRVSAEPSRRKGSAHTSPEGRGLRPPRPRSTPLTSKWGLVSRRHKYRGDPRSRTGLQCGQAIVREGAHRPGDKSIHHAVFNSCVPINTSTSSCFRF